jgi:hypothetical protein
MSSPEPVTLVEDSDIWRLVTPGPYEFDPGGHGGDASVGVPPEPPTVHHVYFKDPGRYQEKYSLPLAELHSPLRFVRIEDFRPVYASVGTVAGNGAAFASIPKLLEICLHLDNIDACHGYSIPADDYSKFWHAQGMAREVLAEIRATKEGKVDDASA